MNALPVPGMNKSRADRDVPVLEPLASVKLKVGIALSGFTTERWFARFLEQLRESEFASLALVILDRRHRLTSEKSSGHSAVFRAFNAFDRKMNSRPNDALASCEIGALLKGVRVIEVTPSQDSSENRAMEAANLDVVVALDDALGREFAAYAKHGAWCVADQRELTVPMFWASYRDEPAYPITVHAIRPDTKPQVIYTSFSPSNEVSFHLGKTESYWKAADILLRNLRYVSRSGVEIVQGAGQNERVATPSNLAAARYALTWVPKAAVYKFNKRYRKEHWFMAYRPNEGMLPLSCSDMTGFRVIASPRDRFYADPFVFERNGKNYLFLEDYRYDLKRGLLSFLEIDADGVHGEPEVILDLPYHLSYPSVFEHDGDIFLVPETGGNRTVELYRATDFPRKWKLEEVLLRDVAAVDPTIFFHEGRFWMFVGGVVEDASPNDELFLFWAESLLGPWHAHARNPVVSDARSARPAGHVFVHDERLIRPSQCWDRRYGAAVSFNRIDALSEDDYAEVSIGRISREWHPGNLGTHTFNQNRSLQVVDGRTRIFR